MNPLNLIPAQYKVAAYGLIALVLLAVSGFILHKAYMWAYNTGMTEERALWQAKENIELATANSTIIQLQADARKKEADNANTLNSISAKYETEKTNEKSKTDDLITKLRNGTIKLRDPNSTPSAQSACSSATSTTSTSSSEHNGQTGSELPEKTSEFLLTITSEADEVVKQLTACQSVIVADRVTCGIIPQE